MEAEKIITGLLDLAKDRESFFSKDGDDEIFKYDHAVLLEAVKAVKDLQEVIKNHGLGLCVICKYGPEDTVKGEHCSKCRRGDNKFVRRQQNIEGGTKMPTECNYDCACVKPAESILVQAKNKGAEALVDSTLRALDEASTKLFSEIIAEAHVQIRKILGSK